jgi:hypothetical protein
MLESDLAYPEQLANDAVATEYSSAYDELSPSEPNKEFVTCIPPAPDYQLPQDALESLISAPSNDEDSLPTHAPPPTLQVLESLGINELQIYSTGNKLLVGDSLLLMLSYILVAKPATFAHDYRTHSDPAAIIAFNLGPRDVDQQRAYTVYAFESFRIGPVESALCAIPLGGYDSSLDNGPESGLAEVALAAAAALRADAVGATGGGSLAWVVAAGSAQATCSTVCQAGDRCFADVTVGALCEEEMFCWDDNNHGLPLVSYKAELEVVTTLVPPAVEFQDIPEHVKPKPVVMVTIASKPSSISMHAL